MDNVILEVERSWYAVSQSEGRTMTVGELIAYLSDHFEPEQKIYLSNDNGYTYGAITEDAFREEAPGLEEETADEVGA